MLNECTQKGDVDTIAEDESVLGTRGGTANKLYCSSASGEVDIA